MRRMICILGLIFSIISIVSCSDSSEQVDNINLVLDNQSRYSVTIFQSNNAPTISVVGVPQSIKLKAGERFVVNDVQSVSVCKAFGWVSYGDRVALDFFSDKPYASSDAVYSPYDITRVRNYQQNYVGNTITYTYTFTDADYQLRMRMEQS